MIECKLKLPVAIGGSDHFLLDEAGNSKDCPSPIMERREQEGSAHTASVSVEDDSLIIQMRENTRSEASEDAENCKLAVYLSKRHDGMDRHNF